MKTGFVQWMATAATAAGLVKTLLAQVSIEKPVMVKNINTAPSYNLNLHPLTEMNGVLIFAAYTGSEGWELWKSDGTEEGTVLVKDINPGPANAFDRQHLPSIINIEGTLFFTANNGSTGFELWKSDGTEAGTVRVKDLYPGPESSYPSGLVNVNGTLFMVIGDGDGQELWRSDGTREGTVRVTTAAFGVENLVNANGTLFFGAYGVTNFGLWKTDGTEAGTIRLNAVIPYGLVNVTGSLFFASNSGTNHSLWKSDGTVAGTVQVKEIVANSAGGLDQFVAVNGTLFFVANKPTSNVNVATLWKSDGTTAGTVPLQSFNLIRNLTGVSGTLFFNAYTRNGSAELWKSDGTFAGTVPVNSLSQDPQQLRDVNGTLFFSAFTVNDSSELWKSDGTASGTILVKDINPRGSGLFGSADPQLVNVNGTVFFPATDGTSGFDLWKSDGTAAGTVRVKRIDPSLNAGSNPYGLAVLDGRLFFQADDGTNRYGIWQSDGTEAGTVPAKRFYDSIDYLVEVNGSRFRNYDDGHSGGELWKIEAGSTEPVLAKDINPGPDDSYPWHLVSVNGTLFFAAYEPAHGYELWKSDGTATGTVLVKDITPGANDLLIDNLINGSGALFFTVNAPNEGYSLWKSDGTEGGTVRVKKLIPGIPHGFESVNGTLFFVISRADDTELWRSDGTDGGTLRLKGFHLQEWRVFVRIA